MTVILRNPNDSEIIHAIEYNSYECMKNMMNEYKDKFQNLKDIEYEESEEYFKVYSGIPFPMANGVINTKLTSEIAEKKINQIITYFEDKNIPFAWVVGPSSEPKDLGELLANKGFIPVQKAPGMACNLKNLIYKTEPLVNLKIVKVKNFEMLKLWADVCITAAEWPKELLLDLWLTISSPDNAFLAYYDGKPVATSYVFYGAGVAGIYNVGTLEDVRNKGIGTAISLAPLYQAKKLGYEIAILQSSEMGLNIYKKIGFKEYCKMETFIWSPS
ncbi:MAG: GNAT family N-acetyltransferase [Promethearchaeota archaeon]